MHMNSVEGLQLRVAALLREKEDRFDCHAGPGTTEPACGACTTCLLREQEALRAEVQELRLRVIPVKRIVITKRSSDVHACLESRGELWGCGKDEREAILSCVLNHLDHFGLRIERI